MKGTSDNRSTLPPSSIHGMRVSRKTSCDGLANNKIKTFARVRFYGFLRPFKFVEKLKGHSENSSFMNDRFLMKFFRRCESCFPFFLVFSFLSLFQKIGQPRPLFRLFLFFSDTNFTGKTVGVSGIQTRIVGVEGEHADHLTTTTFLIFIFIYRLFLYVLYSVNTLATYFI